MTTIVWNRLQNFACLAFTRRFWAIAPIAWCIATTRVSGQGIYLTGIGPVNQSMAGAAVAAPLDAAGAIAWNPATMHGLARSEMSLGLGAVLPTVELGSSAFGMSGTTMGEPGVMPVPTMAFVAKSDENRLAFGLGVSGIGGFSTNFPASSLANPATANPILTPQPPNGAGVGRVFSHAQIYQITPAFSYAVTERLFVSVGPNLDVMAIQADPLFFAPPNPTTGGAVYGPGTGTRFAWGGGFVAGIYFNTDSHWRLGASYKSEQWFEPLRFNSNDLVGNPVFRKATLNLPSITSVGASYTGFQQLLYAVDLRWYDYDSADGFNGSGYRADGSVAGLGWNGVFSISNGLQYQLTDYLSLRCGYTFIDNPIPASQEQFNVGSPLIMQHFFSVGGSYLVHQNVAAHVSYTHGFEAELTGPYVLPGGPVPGTSITSTTSADLLIVGLSVLF